MKTNSNAPLPGRCDRLTHVMPNLEGGVSIALARRYKTGAFGFHGNILAAPDLSSTMTIEQIQGLLAKAPMLASNPVLHRVPESAHLTTIDLS